MITLEDARKAEEQKIRKVFAVFENPMGGLVIVAQDMDTIKRGLEAAGEETPKWAERRFLTREEAEEWVKQKAEETANE